jgi:uncharacterized protein YegP (UPF0339 family)
MHKDGFTISTSKKNAAKFQLQNHKTMVVSQLYERLKSDVIRAI